MAVDTAIAAFTANSAGVTPNYTGLNDSDTFGFRNGGTEILHIANGSGNTATITLVTTKVVDGNEVADKEYTIEDGKAIFIGGLDPAVYNDGDGYATFTCDQASGVEAAVLRGGR